jgi:hypothetical protein
MKVTKEDLLRIREIAAEKGSELTPQQVIDLLRKAKPGIEIIDEPGLVTWLKEHGNTSTSRRPIDS